MSKKANYIKKEFGAGYSDSYPDTVATLIKKKVEVKVEAAKGDLVLLVTKKGHENTAGHVGKVTAVRAKDYSFETMINGEVKTFKMPYNFLAKSGMVTIGFYTTK